MKYIAVIAALCMLLLDTLLRATVGVRVPLATVLWDCARCLLWIALTPTVVWLAAIMRYRRRARLRFILVHATAVLALTVAHASLFVLLRIAVAGTPLQSIQPLVELSALLPRHLILGLFVYGQTLLATQMSFFLQASRRREEERLALERWLVQAELDLYRLQLPVAVVNERLLEIERTIGLDPERAEMLIERFSAFLRSSLAAVNVDADIDEVAHDEEELKEDFPPALPLLQRFLLLFSIIPVTHLIVNAIVVLIPVAIANQPLWPAITVVVKDNLSSSLLYFPVTAAMVWLGSQIRRIAVLLAVAVAVSFAWHIGLITVTQGFDQARKTLIPMGLFLDCLLNFGIALGALTHSRYRTWRAASGEVVQLESRVLRTRATILRLQLNPHFLFNTLNSVAALIEDDVPSAARMASQLRQFVVRVLESSDRQEVPLSEELDSLVTYVAIENMRFGGRVELRIEAEVDARSALVPGFLLQPLVENSLRHGLLPAGGGRVSVQATIIDDTLRITVDDNGNANPNVLPSAEGLGLSNTRARLAQLYGDDYSLDVGTRKHGFGVAVVLARRTSHRGLHL